MTLLLDIVTTASVLFIVSAGLLAIFGVLQIINFAHGAWLTLGAYCAVMTAGFGLNPWMALPIAFVIGGLIDDRARTTLNRIPGLSQIPVLGELFKSRESRPSRNEIVILVTPTIIEA